MGVFLLEVFLTAALPARGLNDVGFNFCFTLYYWFFILGRDPYKCEGNFH